MIAVLLTAVLGMTILTGCGREPEPLTDETTLLLMEREILRRDHELPPNYIQYHLEHGGLPVEEEESPTVRAVLQEVERYLPKDFSDYFSQADKIVQDVGDAMSQAQGVMSQVDELTSGAGKELIDGIISEAQRQLAEDETGNSGAGENLCEDLHNWDVRFAEDSEVAGTMDMLESGVRINVDHAGTSTDQATIIYTDVMLEPGASYHIEFDYAATCDLHWILQVWTDLEPFTEYHEDEPQTLGGIMQHYSGDFTTTDDCEGALVSFLCSDISAETPYSFVVQNLTITKQS